MVSDENAIVQVMLNLLDNAQKYSPEGGVITISIAQGEETVRIMVTDTGIGIPAGN